MNTIKSPLPVRDAEAARHMQVEPARPAASRTLIDLIGALNDSLIQDGIEDYLERILGWGAEPLRRDEISKILPALHGCVWRLVTEALQRAKGRPDKDLIKRIGSAARLHDQEDTVGFTPDDAYARRLASLVSALLDDVSDDDDSPLPDFGAAAVESRRSA